jgi:predicted dehydrogenase
MTGAPRLRLGIVCVGKIAREQHLPAIAGSPDFTLVAAASRNATLDGFAHFDTIEAMLATARRSTSSRSAPRRAVAIASHARQSLRASMS